MPDWVFDEDRLRGAAVHEKYLDLFAMERFSDPTPTEKRCPLRIICAARRCEITQRRPHSRVRQCSPLRRAIAVMH